MEFKLQTFNMQYMQMLCIDHNPIIYVCGKEKSGKTVLIQDILFQNKHVEPNYLFQNGRKDDVFMYSCFIEKQKTKAVFVNHYTPYWQLENAYEKEDLVNKILTDLEKETTEKTKQKQFVVLDEVYFFLQKTNRRNSSIPEILLEYSFLENSEKRNTHCVIPIFSLKTFFGIYDNKEEIFLFLFEMEELLLLSISMKYNFWFYIPPAIINQLLLFLQTKNNYECIVLYFGNNNEIPRITKYKAEIHTEPYYQTEYVCK